MGEREGAGFGNNYQVLTYGESRLTDIGNTEEESEW